MHPVVNADDELDAVKRSIQTCELEIAECKEGLAGMAKGDPERAVWWQRLAALDKQLAALREEKVLLLQQAQGGFAETAARACNPPHSPIGPIVCLLCSSHEAWCAALEYSAGHVLQLHSVVCTSRQLAALMCTTPHLAFPRGP
jgi:hypothetical protein